MGGTKWIFSIKTHWDIRGYVWKKTPPLKKDPPFKNGVWVFKGGSFFKPEEKIVQIVRGDPYDLGQNPAAEGGRKSLKKDPPFKNRVWTFKGGSFFKHIPWCETIFLGVSGFSARQGIKFYLAPNGNFWRALLPAVPVFPELWWVDPNGEPFMRSATSRRGYQWSNMVGKKCTNLAWILQTWRGLNQAPRCSARFL